MANLKYYNNSTSKWEEIKVSTRFKELLNTKKLTADQNYVNIGITNYNPVEDVIFVIQNRTWLQKKEDYIINGGLLRIESKDGSNWKNGDTFNFVVLKNVDKEAVPTADGSLIQDGSITIAKLATSLQNYINKIGDTKLTTIADDLSGAVNEINSQLSDMTNVSNNDSTDNKTQFESKLPILALGFGSYKVSTVNINDPAHVYGHGCADALYSFALSEIATISPAADAILASASGVLLEKFSILNKSTTTPTDGAGLHISNTNTFNGNSLRLNDVSIKGFYDNIKMENGAEWYAKGLFLYDPVRYGFYYRNTSLPDGGDFSLSDFQFIAGPNNLSPASGFRWESGGGARIINGKINSRGSASFANGLEFSLQSGVKTADIQIANCSIENCSNAGIRIASPDNTSTVGRVIIDGCEFQAEDNSSAILIPPIPNSNSVTVSSVVISDNVFASSVTNKKPVIDLENVGRARIEGNIFEWYPDTNVPLINLGQNTFSVTVGENTFAKGTAGTNTLLISNPQNSSQTGYNKENSFDGKFSWPIPTSADTSASDTNLWALNLWGWNNSARIDLTIHAYVEGKGFSVAKLSRLALNSGSNINVQTVGTDTFNGAMFDVDWNISGNDLVIAIKPNTSAGGTGISGYSVLEVNGAIENIRAYN